ncbi:transcription factor bHLH95-like [Cucurbita maxima]|uniref:Transcription factor bHLH95-like n=1 Tax=Cucurbita maxima TaxID=3661 RepID=A0A6J1JNK3_CUCMA|nr:transcription factor bHLH95-like [Cucurbita maxima]
MAAPHNIWAFLNSSSDIDIDIDLVDDNDNDNSNDQSPANTDLLPPLPLSGRKREAVEGRPGRGVESTEHEIHIWTERERRKKMRNMFSNLHALIPHLPPKADKSTIVDEAVNYIKTVQQTLQKLYSQKLEKLQNNNPAGSYKAVHYHPQQQQSSSTTTTRQAFLADQASSSNGMSSTLLPPPLSPLLPPFYDTTTAFQTWTSSNLVLSICGGEAHFCICSVKKPGLFAAVCYIIDKHQIEVVSAHVSSDFHRMFIMIQAHVNGSWDEFGAAMVAEEMFKQAAGEINFWLSS